MIWSMCTFVVNEKKNSKFKFQLASKILTLRSLRSVKRMDRLRDTVNFFQPGLVIVFSWAPLFSPMFFVPVSIDPEWPP